MILSKREKYVAIGTATAIALLVIDSFIVEPFISELSAIQDGRAQAARQIVDAAATFSHQNKLKKIWADMQANGLKTQEAQADSQLYHALLDWAQQAGANTQVLKSDLPKKEGLFTVIGYRVTATGTMRSISRLLWDLETATIPIRVTDVRVTPQREGTDDLSLQVGVSTLCAPPDAVTPPAQAGMDERGVGL